jgi:hypothetical protein
MKGFGIERGYDFGSGIVLIRYCVICTFAAWFGMRTLHEGDDQSGLFVEAMTRGVSA